MARTKWTILTWSVMALSCALILHAEETRKGENTPLPYSEPADAGAQLFFGNKRKLPPRLTTAQITEFIADLGHEEFPRREAAFKALDAAKEQVAPEVEAALAQASGAEMKKSLALLNRKHGRNGLILKIEAKKRSFRVDQKTEWKIILENKSGGDLNVWVGHTGAGNYLSMGMLLRQVIKDNDDALWEGFPYSNAFFCGNNLPMLQTVPSGDRISYKLKVSVEASSPIELKDNPIWSKRLFLRVGEAFFPVPDNGEIVLFACLSVPPETSDEITRKIDDVGTKDPNPFRLLMPVSFVKKNADAGAPIWCGCTQSEIIEISVDAKSKP